MVIALFGDSCTGKSTVAKELAQQFSAQVYSGKDYLKLAKSESMAADLFKKKLAGEETMVYVISEKEQLALLPQECVRLPLCWSGNTGNLKPHPMTCALTQTKQLRKLPQSGFFLC